MNEIRSKKLRVTRNPRALNPVVQGESSPRRHERAGSTAHASPTPPHAGAASNPHGAAPATGIPTRRCRRHRGLAPKHEFLLLEDPVARARGWATRHWCGDCLVAGGHITRHQLARIRRAHEHQARSEQIAVELYDRAAADPTFASALRLATSALDAPREDLAQVVGL